MEAESPQAALTRVGLVLDHKLYDIFFILFTHYLVQFGATPDSP